MCRWWFVFSGVELTDNKGHFLFDLFRSLLPLSVKVFNAEQNVSMMSFERHHCMKTLLIPFLPAISQSNTERDSMSGRSTSALEQWTQAFIHCSDIKRKIRGWKGTDLHLAPIPLQFVILVWMFLGFWYAVIIIIIIQTRLFCHSIFFWTPKLTDTSEIMNYTQTLLAILVWNIQKYTLNLKNVNLTYKSTSHCKLLTKQATIKLLKRSI